MRIILTYLPKKMVALAFGIGYGVYVSFFTIISQLIEPYKYTSGQIGLIGIVMVLAGIVGSFIFGFILDRTRKYTIILLIGYSFTCKSYSLPKSLLTKRFDKGLGLYFVYFELQDNNFGLLTFACALGGFFSISMLPVGMVRKIDKFIISCINSICRLFFSRKLPLNSLSQSLKLLPLPS